MEFELVNRLILATPDKTEVVKVIEAGVYYIANAIVQSEQAGADAEDLQTQVIELIRNAVILMREYTLNNRQE